MAEIDKATLTQGEVMLARTLAAFRTGMNRITNVKQPVKFGKRDDFENDLIGICGEIALAKRLNVYLDLSFNPRSGGSDLKFPDGSTVDVKTTELNRGQLVVPLYKQKNPSEYYALVTGVLPTSNLTPVFRIRGYASAEEVFSSTKDLGYGPCFALPQEELRAFQ